MSLESRIVKLEAHAAPQRARPVVALFLDTGRGDFVQRGYGGDIEPCANAAAVLAEAEGQGFSPKCYAGIDPDWL